MKQRLKDLFNQVLSSNKTLIHNKNWENWKNSNDLFNLLTDKKFGSKDDNIYAVVNILSCSNKENLRSIATGIYSYGVWTDGFTRYYNKNDINQIKGEHEILPCTEIDIPMDKIYGVSISFPGKNPNMYVYMTYDKKHKRTTKHKKRVRYFSYKRITMIEYDISLKYYIKFGSTQIELEEKEYKDLIEYSLQSVEDSNRNIVERISENIG